MISIYQKITKKTIIKLIVWGLYIIGFVFLVYPFASNAYHQSLQKSVVKEYQEKVAQQDTKELATIKEKMADHNERLVDQQAVMSPENFGVEAERNVQKGMASPKREALGEVIAVLEIPKINLELPVYYGTNSQQISKGAGVMEETSLPFGGKGTHSVITSHRGLPTAKLFTDLPELTLTDLFFIKIAGETHAYEVDRIKVIEPEDFSQLEVVKGQDYITLLTCTPYMVNTHRLLVRGHRVNPYTSAIRKKAVKAGHWHQFKKYAMYALVALSIFILFYLVKGYRDNKGGQKTKGQVKKRKKSLKPIDDKLPTSQEVIRKKKQKGRKKRRKYRVRGIK
ncbi:class C sortase [uncultured Vagococcus sp.]|uniref:class C sortase n=1 Tax=uncultured Vagococcus sp. TaxID=189676 RepID=UPI0028CFF225|nr:class C sortase [uncultured Vagococcus sp.]